MPRAIKRFTDLHRHAVSLRAQGETYAAIAKAVGRKEDWVGQCMAHPQAKELLKDYQALAQRHKATEDPVQIAKSGVARNVIYLQQVADASPLLGPDPPTHTQRLKAAEILINMSGYSTRKSTRDVNSTSSLALSTEEIEELQQRAKRGLVENLAEKEGVIDAEFEAIEGKS